MHVQISPDTKFQPKLTILIFWTKFAQKGYFRSKAENPHFCVRPWSLVIYYVKFFRTGADIHNGILTSLLVQVAETKLVARFDKKIVACRKKSTDNPREESITDDPEEEPTTDDSTRET